MRNWNYPSFWRDPSCLTVAERQKQLAYQLAHVEYRDEIEHADDTIQPWEIPTQPVAMWCSKPLRAPRDFIAFTIGLREEKGRDPLEEFEGSDWECLKPKFPDGRLLPPAPEPMPKRPKKVVPTHRKAYGFHTRKYWEKQKAKSLAKVAQAENALNAMPTNQHDHP